MRAAWLSPEDAQRSAAQASAEEVLEALAALRGDGDLLLSAEFRAEGALRFAPVAEAKRAPLLVEARFGAWLRWKAAQWPSLEWKLSGKKHCTLEQSSTLAQPGPARG